MKTETSCPFQVSRSHALQGNGYVLDVVVSPSRDIVATPTASGAIHIFDSKTLNGLKTLNVTSPTDRYDDVLSQATFDQSNPSLLFAGTTNGTVRVWDLRTGNSELIFNCGKPVLSLAVNSANTALAAGTELVGEDSEISIWDVRNNSAPAARFLECHSDDVTQLRFHPTDRNAMISGSTDGLICLYNLETLEEEDALYQVIKEDSIGKIGFFGPQYEYIYSLSHMETFSLYKFLEGDKVFTFGDVRGEAQQTKVDYLIDCVYDERNQRMFLVTGDQTGNMAIFHVNLGRLELVHTLNSGHSDIVRGAYWDVEYGSLISGGEDSIVSLWRNQ
ncbi:WD40-repeat-containing domain protein [Powellomyces hirtus]|nr:WD40-repeat-containing domain protein [Powellomyces hirtus]